MKLWPPEGWFGGKDREANRTPSSSELMDLEWREAETLWKARKALEPAVDTAAADALDHLFYDHEGNLNAPDWPRINEVERQLALLLTEAQLKTQYSLLLSLAGQRALASLATYPSRADFNDAPVEAKRASYGALLYELQVGFIEGRLVRRLRRKVAETLWGYGMRLAAVAILVPLVWLYLTSLSLPTGEAKPVDPAPLYIDETIFILASVASAGALGAFFSRVMRFQTDISSLTYDAFDQTYVARMLRLRLLYGVMGAIVFYFFIRGQFVGGNLFPTLLPGMVTEQTTWTLHSAGQAVRGASNAPLPKGITSYTQLSPTGEFAKLLVWSFLAGFSERLVPDTLGQLEKQSSDAVQSGKS